MESINAKKMGFECSALIRQIISKQLTIDEIYIKLRELHDKFPFPGHNPPLSSYQIQNYHHLEVVIPNDKGIKAVSFLQPMNFKEAAEMYAATRYKRVRDFQERAAGEEIEVPF